MPSPLRKRLQEKWDSIFREIPDAMGVSTGMSLATKRMILRFASAFADTSRDRFIAPDLAPEVQPKPEQGLVTVTRTLGEVCRLHWPLLHLDLRFHYTSPLHSSAPPTEIVATINVRSEQNLVPSVAQLHVHADGKTMNIDGEGSRGSDPSIARVAFTFPFPTGVLAGLVMAKNLQLDLAGLCFPLRSNAKKAIQHLISYELPGQSKGPS